MCLYPKLIKNRKYTANKKNGGVIPPVIDERTRWVPIGCQKCMECRKQKARGWQVRLLEDIKQNTNGKFITLTFSNEWIKNIVEGYTNDNNEWVEGIGTELEGYELDNQIATVATRYFLERWRKTYGRTLRHWFVTELGHEGTENIHIHGIVWPHIEGTIPAIMNEIEKHWKHGFVWKWKIEKGRRVNYVNESTVNYIIKYVTKADGLHKEYKSIILTSPGIGKNYTEAREAWKKAKFKGTETDETYRTRTGHKIALPIYWRNKVFTDQEREALWLQKLDKQVRWVCGEKIDISKDERDYYAVLQHYRDKNTRLGYGNDTKDWSREQYERQRRLILQKARMAPTRGGAPDAGGGRVFIGWLRSATHAEPNLNSQVTQMNSKSYEIH